MDREVIIIPPNCTQTFSVPVVAETSLEESLRLQAQALDAYEVQAKACAARAAR